MVTSAELRCLGCGSDRVSPLTLADSSSSSKEQNQLVFRILSEKPRLFGGHLVTVSVWARVCFACGYVMHFVDPKGLEDLLAHEGDLAGKGPRSWS